MRRAKPADVDEIRRYLHDRIETSMFPLANLMDHGLDGVQNRAMAVWLAPEGRGVFCMTNDGMMQPQLPDERDWETVPDLVRGRSVIGCTGEHLQVRGVLSACGLENTDAEINDDEPLMRLSLDQLVHDAPLGKLVPLSQVPFDQVAAWRASYLREVLGVVDELDAIKRGKEDVSRQIAADSHRCLVVEGDPVAVTGFNARYEDTVQIGGVYTPPGLRRRGHAGTALALHLAEAQRDGAAKAVLFAASETAVGVYRRLGFLRCGTYTLCVFKSAQEVK